MCTHYLQRQNIMTVIILCVSLVTYPHPSSLTTAYCDQLLVSSAKARLILILYIVRLKSSLINFYKSQLYSVIYLEVPLLVLKGLRTLAVQPNA